MRYILLAVLIVFLTSCAEVTVNRATCKNGNSCPEGEECVDSLCYSADEVCSSSNFSGVCEDGFECVSGYCNPINLTPCNPNPCIETNKTVCVDLGRGDYQCNCDQGYSDDGSGNCIEDISDPCDPNPCVEQNRSVCTNSNGSPICSCDEGYIDNENGDCIENITDPCEPNPCSEINKTVCTDSNGVAVCSCDNGYSDDGFGNCIEIIVDPCDPNPCTDSNKTVCTNSNGTAVCSCNDGYIEDQNGSCIEEQTPCSSQNPDGYCDDGYGCVYGECELKRVGSKCEDDTDCLDGLTCLKDDNLLSEGVCTKSCATALDCALPNSQAGCSNYNGSMYCLESCSDNQCRDDFVCRNNDFLCVPSCSSDNDCDIYETCQFSFGAGECVIEQQGCDIFNQSCPSGDSCYLFTEISDTACGRTGILGEGESCDRSNICMEGLICTENSFGNKECLSPCKPSQGVIENPQCEQYDRCIIKPGLNDIGYCSFDQSLIPMGAVCTDTMNSSDCPNGASCLGFYNTEDVDICMGGCDGYTTGEIDGDIYPNWVICVSFGTEKYWMDTCSSNSDCLDSNIICRDVKEYTNSPYSSNYCFPKPIGYDCNKADENSCSQYGSGLGCYSWDYSTASCGEAGTVAIGGDCSNANCVPGAECLNDGEGSRCYELCTHTSPIFGCSDGGTCGTITGEDYYGWCSFE